MRIPSGKEIRALHEKHAPTPEAFHTVYTHCLIVAEIARQLADRNGKGNGSANEGGGQDPDPELVRAGALLHDIGVYRLYDDAGRLDHANYLRHGVLGQELLEREGFSEAITRFASHHTGVGLTKDDVVRQGLPLPPGDYLAETEAERLVMYADKFHSKSDPPAFLTAGAYAARVRRFGADKVTAFTGLRQRFGEPDLGALAARYGHPVATDR